MNTLHKDPNIIGEGIEGENEFEWEANTEQSI